MTLKELQGMDRKSIECQGAAAAREDQARRLRCYMRKHDNTLH